MADDGGDLSDERKGRGSESAVAETPSVAPLPAWVAAAFIAVCVALIGLGVWVAWLYRSSN